MLDPTQFSNPYLQGNPLVPQLSPEMQAAVRQRSIFNAGAAMLGSAGRGENILSGLSQAGQTYGGSLDAMMREGLQYQAMANKAAHEKDLFKLQQDELKQRADIASKENEIRKYISDQSSAASKAQAALAYEQLRQEKENRMRQQAVGNEYLMGQVSKKAVDDLRAQGGEIDPSNPAAVAAATKLYLRQQGLSSPLDVQGSAKVANSILDPGQLNAYAVLSGGVSPGQAQAAFPGLHKQNSLLGGLGDLNIPPPTQGPVDTSPKTFEEYERIKEQNAAAQAKTKEFESTVGPASKVSRYLLGPLGGAPQDKWVSMTIDQHNKTKEYIKQNFATLSPQEKELAAEYLDFASSPEKIESFKRMRKTPSPLNPFGGLDKILNYRASQGLPNP